MIQPKDRPVECIQLSCEAENKQDKGRETDKIEVNCLRGPESWDDYKDSNEEIAESDNFKKQPLPL